jgi:PIN domain nuclease of toxin-antitoxin system
VRALLDTHVLLFWLDGDSRLNLRQRAVLRKASAQSPLLVSDISLWEIAMLSSLGRIRLRLPVRNWLESAVAPPLVQRVSISPSVASEVATLPSTFTRDPADRIIVASARIHGATLLTLDERIIGSDLVPTL